MKKLILLLFFFGFKAFSQESFSVKVNVKNVEKIEGKLYYAITNNEDIFPNFEKFSKKGEIEIKDNNVFFEFNNLEKGNYAIIIFQDLNGNKKLDKRFFPPIPKEPYGVSNNSKAFGKPKYKDAQFIVERNIELDILLK